MKYTRLLAVVVIALGFAAPARAQDGKEALRQATDALQKVPVYRITMQSTDRNTKVKDSAILEVAQPSLTHIRREVDGHVQMEMVSDGTRTFLRRGEGNYEAAPAGVGTMLTTMRNAALSDTVMKMAKDVRPAGHEDLHGVPTSIYLIDTEMMGLQGTQKIWISDRDHLPVKSEGVSRGLLTRGSGKTIDRESVTTFDYDPSIRIVLP